MSTPETMRAWAKGAYDCEAGVELVIRSGLAERGLADAWDKGSFDSDRYMDLATGPWSGGERRLLLLAGNILGVEGCRTIHLDDALSGLDRRSLHLALAALAHAGGSHQHSDVSFDAEGLPSFGGGYLPPLVDWPA